VGRGALAGPVLVGAVAMPVGFKTRKKGLPILKDSKKLSESQREEWVSFIKKSEEVVVETARVSAGVVDRINISQAGNLAGSRAMERLIKRVGEKNIKGIILDKGLKLGILSSVKIKTEVKADEKYKEVMLASVMAKVERDKYMKRLHKKFPNYGFLNHVGYGTEEHRKQIKLCGLSDIHRKSFCGKLIF